MGSVRIPFWLLVLAAVAPLLAWSCVSHAPTTLRPPLRSPAALSASAPPPPAVASAPPPSTEPVEDLAAIRAKADAWRAAHKLIDLHMHIEATPERMAEAVRIMDSGGIGVGINLRGGTTTHRRGQPSSFDATKKLADTRFPGRFVEYMNLDYTDWDKPDFAKRAVAQVEEGARLGAGGFKEFKRLGLFLRDKKGQLLKVDDPKLDPMWRRLGELGMPVSIHVADPKAFWGPYDATNERWKELKDHPHWWFGDPKRYPPRDDLRAAR